MDSTFGTNNAGMDMFAVLAEAEGTGVPLAYYFPLNEQFGVMLLN
jgi:hypothetical protein